MNSLQCMKIVFACQLYCSRRAFIDVTDQQSAGKKIVTVVDVGLADKTQFIAGRMLRLTRSASNVIGFRALNLCAAQPAQRDHGTGCANKKQFQWWTLDETLSE